MLAVITAGFAPGLALLSYFYLRGPENDEPVTKIGKSFVSGAILVFPLMFIQYVFQTEGLLQETWQDAFLLSALLEEFFKWFILFFTVYQHVSFDRHYEGIIYAAAVSLGFATVENVLYLFQFGIDVAFGRALLPVSSHALFGVVMGYYAGKAKTGPGKLEKRYLLLALTVPVLLHGTYDFILLTFSKYWPVLMTPFMFYLWWNALRKVKMANRRQPDWNQNLDGAKKIETGS
ncbi:glutamic-type intramembrane protease PrsW [Bacillus marinisedimentorum]|uniref:glutamic-type intramembrane protease PrsW n=1 Tax=Bacillus marinisedimentorum TaxID=1821260 RepID=UPI0008722299|nr:glutamic-type intramembrane protease PrsW [Bacillus marinisedimentorum]